MRRKVSNNEIGCDDANWIHVPYNRDQWRPLLNTVTQLWIV
jgi:hypothetical protein